MRLAVLEPGKDSASLTSVPPMAGSCLLLPSRNCIASLSGVSAGCISARSRWGGVGHLPDDQPVALPLCISFPVRGNPQSTSNCLWALSHSFGLFISSSEVVFTARCCDLLNPPSFPRGELGTSFSLPPTRGASGLLRVRRHLEPCSSLQVLPELCS